LKDALSYRSVDVPSSRIFTVDPSGELKQELLQNFKSSYQQLNDIVDQVFPSVRQSMNTTFADFSYWREPLPALDNVIEMDHQVSTETGVDEDSSSGSEIELPE
jgi:phosphatidate phosphatase LPIN